jgi:hypothetical protein
MMFTIHAVRIGTHHFVNRGAAVRYFLDYEDSMNRACRAVERKLRDGSIKLGRPETQPGERLVLVDNATRYAIVVS